MKTFKPVIEFRIFPHEENHSRRTYGSFSIIFLFIRRNRRHIYKWESSKPKAITTYVIMWLIKRSVDKHMFVINMLLDI